MTARTTLAAALASLSALAVALAPATASAVERQHKIGLGPTVDLLKVDDKSTVSVGGGLALQYTYGLNDMFNLMVEAGGAIVALHQDQDTPTTPRTRPSEVDHATIGVGYVIDILRWVPYVGVLAGGYRLSGGTLDSALFLPGVEVGVGLDYQLSRSWAVGAAVRQHFLFTKMSDYPSFTTGLLHLSYMWGW